MTRSLKFALTLTPLLACSTGGVESTGTERSSLGAGTVAAFGLDATTGSVASDTSGLANHGALAGATWTSTAKFGQALAFSGSNQRVNVPDANSLDLSTAMTLEAWVRPSSTAGDWRTVIVKESATGLAYALYATDGANQPPAAYINVNGQDVQVRGATALPVNAWTHLAATYDGGVFRLYVGGVQVASRAVTGRIAVTTAPFRIGGNAPWGEYFAGQIDEVLIYGRALSASEIQADMNAPISGGSSGTGGNGGAGGSAGNGGSSGKAGAGSGGAGGTAGGGTGGAGTGGAGTGGAGTGGSGAGRAGSAGAATGGTGTAGTGSGSTGGTGTAGTGTAGTGSGSTGGTGTAGTGSAGAQNANLTIDVTQRLQIVDGFGVSANSGSWDNGELVPALDLLVAGGSTIFRVVAEITDWEQSNDDADASHANWCVFRPIYTSPRFEELWSTIAYLNSKGIRDRVVLNFMGKMAPWMGGGDLLESQIDEWVETVATVAYYGRVTRGLEFGMFAPTNETDWDGIEGPHMSPSVHATALRRLAQKLDQFGLSDLRLMGPDTASLSQGVGPYLQAFFADPYLMSRLDHLALHDYGGNTANAYGVIQSSAYPFKNFWITELSIWDHAFSSLSQNAAAVLVWDGFDSVYNHAIPGHGSQPPNDAGNGPALIAYNASSRTYTPRKEYYQYAQLFQFVPPGSQRIGLSETLQNVSALAFRSAATGRITIVGRNTGSTTTISARGFGNISTFQHYRTSDSENMARQNDVPTSGGGFNVAVPNGIFTLTGLPTGECTP